MLFSLWAVLAFVWRFRCLLCEVVWHWFCQSALSNHHHTLFWVHTLYFLCKWKANLIIINGRQQKCPTDVHLVERMNYWQTQLLLPLSPIQTIWPPLKLFLVLSPAASYLRMLQSHQLGRWLVTLTIQIRTLEFGPFPPLRSQHLINTILLAIGLL